MTENQIKYWTWTARILALLGLVAGVLAAAEKLPEWFRAYAAITVALFGVGNGWIRGFLPAVKSKVLPPVALAAIAALLLTACPSAHSPAMKTAAALKRAETTVDRTLAATPGITCRQLMAYRDNARPAVRSSVGAIFAGVRINREAGKTDLDYMAIGKPGACALILGLREWGHKIPDKGQAVLALLQGFAGLVCSTKGPRDALGVLAALLPVAVDLVKWIVQLVGAPDAALESEVSAWLLAPPSGEVDKAIATRCSP